jgi:RNA polymerase sigma factor (sigma-70 family)
MLRSPTASRRTCGSRLRRLRQHAGLTRAALAAISGIDLGFIRAFENNSLAQLISDQEIEQALIRFNGRGPQRVMQRTLHRWAENLHQLADALADNFENLFPAADLAALSDQLWLKIRNIEPQYIGPTASPQSSDNPWHDWGWYRNVALPDDLTDDDVDDQFADCELRPVIRELLAGLNPREQFVIALRYGFDGPTYTLAEIGQRLGVAPNRVGQIERGALRHLKHSSVRRRLRDFLN